MRECVHILDAHTQQKRVIFIKKRVCVCVCDVMCVHRSGSPRALLPPFIKLFLPFLKLIALVIRGDMFNYIAHTH